MVKKHWLLAINSFPLVSKVASREASSHWWGCFLGGVKVFTPAVSQLRLMKGQLSLRSAGHLQHKQLSKSLCKDSLFPELEVVSKYKNMVRCTVVASA